MLSNWIRVTTGKLGSVAAWNTYVTAPAAAVQLNVMTSYGWNVEYPFGGPSEGVPGAPGPTPVTLKLRAADHALCSNAPLTACTRQKYVPLARPLTVAAVV